MRILIRHFFQRFLDKESLSPQGEPEANLTQALGFLAAPGAFIVLLFQPLDFRGWDLVMIRCFFVSFSMIIIGFIVVFEWDALFPDRRDYQILTPLPVGLWTLFLAKALAFGLFLGLFLVDVNFFSVLMWPGIDGGRNLVGTIGAHLVTVILSGLFAGLMMAALQGVLVAVLPAAAFRRVSVWMQTMLMGILVMLLFLSPRLSFFLSDLARRHSPWVYAFPAYWFAGLYEHLRPAVGNPVHLLHHPHDRNAVAFLLHLGSVAEWALAGVAGLFVVTYLPGYRRHARKVLEAPQPNPSGPTRLKQAINRTIDRKLLKHPVQIGVFHFVSQTITRSMKHRLFLATYAGCGGALALLTFGSGRSGLLRLPLTLSFILISALRAAFNFPSELGANWSFQVSGSNHVRECLAAMRKWIVACAVVPLLLLQAPMEFLAFAWLAAVFHLAFGTALAVLLMEGLFLGFRKVPFTCAYFPGKINLVALSVIYVLGFTMYSNTMADLEAWLEGEPLAVAAFFAAAGLAYALLARWRNRQLGTESILDYEDDGDPAVRTLELSA
jgi:hypothetical protein